MNDEAEVRLLRCSEFAGLPLHCGKCFIGACKTPGGCYSPRAGSNTNQISSWGPQINHSRAGFGPRALTLTYVIYGYQTCCTSVDFTFDADYENQ